MDTDIHKEPLTLMEHFHFIKGSLKCSLQFFGGNQKWLLYGITAKNLLEPFIKSVLYIQIVYNKYNIHKTLKKNRKCIGPLLLIWSLWH